MKLPNFQIFLHSITCTRYLQLATQILHLVIQVDRFDSLQFNLPLPRITSTISLQSQSSRNTQTHHSLSRGISTVLLQQFSVVSYCILQFGAAYGTYLKRLERQSFHLLTTTGVLLFATTMSLIGSEVNIMEEVPNISITESQVPDDSTDVALTEISVDGYGGDKNGPSSVSYDSSGLLSPVSPPRAAERIFLSDLATQNIAACDLAEQIHQSRSSSKSSHRSNRHHNTNLSIETTTSKSDWASAAGTDDDSFFSSSAATPKLQPTSTRTTDTIQTPFSSPESIDEESAYENFFKKDVLSRKIRDLSEVDEETYLDSDMATPSTSTSTPGKFFPSEAPQHLDAAEMVYDTAKGVWAWGKSITVFKPFLGLTEAMAGKFVETMGSDLASVDGIVLDKLHDFDDSMLNPAIAAVLGALLGAAGKSEDVLKPLIIAILKPLGLIKDTAENPEVTPVPGVTTVVQ